MKFELRTKHRKSKVAVEKKINSAKYFYISMLPNLCAAESSWISERPELDLGNKRQRSQATRIFRGFSESDITVGNKKISGSCKTISIKINVQFIPVKDLHLRCFLRNKIYRCFFLKLSLNVLYQALFRKIQ